MLLFLNHVKMIRLSVIKEDGEIVREYEVTSILAEKSEVQRKELSSLIRKYKDKPTIEVPRKECTYLMITSDSNNIKEKWLIHQCCGVDVENKDDTVPDGRQHGLFPRGGVAALVSSSAPMSVAPRSRPRYVAYCFLPLPSCYTWLPVYVNGHFALDTARRTLWQDESPNGPLTRWNNFLKTRVLAPGYASLILEAQKHIPHCQKDPQTTRYFASEITADAGLSWYHNLFPNVYITDEAWRTLAIEVYRFLGKTSAPVLPIVVADETGENRDPQKLPRRIRNWLPVHEVFFKDKSTPDVENLWKLLLRIRLTLSLYAPHFVYVGFQKAVMPSLVNPQSVIDFVRTFQSRNSSCEIGKLPRKLEETKIRSKQELRELINYCNKEEKFSSLLQGLPLLLTADGQLRVFDESEPVYRSMFSDLFPGRAHSFVHPDFVYTIIGYNESTSQVMRGFTVEALAQFMPDIFPHDTRGLTKHLTWAFPKNGLLSQEWFKRLWEFLQTQSNPDENEQQLSLEALREWPVIPTTCGTLVTIGMAKTVLDLTESGTETARQKKVRKFLEQIKCPVLNKAITLKESDARTRAQSNQAKPHNTAIQVTGETTISSHPPHRKAAVTDPYVAHPHSVADVLEVLDYMMKTGTLDVSMLSDEDISEILQFFQAEYENLEPKLKYDKILKDLPLYKTIDGTHVSLSAFSSYALVPGDVPLVEIAKLQNLKRCLFLHSDALPTLDKLYKALGTGAERCVSKFFLDFILPSFDIFHRDSQLAFLTHIKDKVLPISYEKEELLRYLQGIRCIPDQQGKLHYAKEFYNRRNDVFQNMLAEDSDKFPPSPFNEDVWLDFLILIGLQEDVDEKQFLEFCHEVELRDKTGRIASKSRWTDEMNVKRSKSLVGYLSTKAHLHNTSFLRKVSTIKFIASEKVEADLLAVHDQYECKAGQRPPFVQFQSSVPWKQNKLVWTSTVLLPDWAQRRIQTAVGGNGALGLKKTTQVTVVQHLKNISVTLENCATEGSLSNPGKIKAIMFSIYKFLSGITKCTGKDLSNQCTTDCKRMGHDLEALPCVFVEEDEAFVRGEQLSFNTLCANVLKPFLYTVPREFGGYQHFLKRLGATETVSPLQLVNVLKAIKGQCKDKKMCSECEEKSRVTMYLLFQLIVDKPRGMRELESCELYLPSRDKFLVKSDELVCKVPPHLVQTVAKMNCHVLLPFEACGLSRERATDYLDALPARVRPTPLDSLVREELDPSCKMTRVCLAEMAPPAVL